MMLFLKVYHLVKHRNSKIVARFLWKYGIFAELRPEKDACLAKSAVICFLRKSKGNLYIKVWCVSYQKAVPKFCRLLNMLLKYTTVYFVTYLGVWCVVHVIL